MVAIKRAVHASLSAAPGIPQVFPWRATRPVAKGNTTSRNTTAPRAKYPRGKAGKIDRRTWMVYVSDQAKWASKNQRSRNDQCKTASCSKRFEQEVSICADVTGASGFSKNRRRLWRPDEFFKMCFF